MEAIVSNAHEHALNARLRQGSAKPSMVFHRLVVKARHNRLLTAVALMLLDEANDPLERLLEPITLDSRVARHQIVDHLALEEAMRLRHEAEAERFIRERMRDSIESAELFRKQRGRARSQS